jgi:hypothetical protein
MKKLFTPLRLAALTGLALAASIGMGHAQTFTQGETYTQPFDVGTNTANFSGSGSVASWIYWFNIPGGNLAMTNDVSMDAGNSATSGSLIYSVPWATASNTQDVIFGTFGNTGGYDTGVSGDMTSYDNINFFVRVDPSTAPRLVAGIPTDFGTINAGFFFPYTFEQEGSATIPLSASNSWVHLTVPVSLSSAQLTGISGIAFSFASFGNSPPPYPALQNSIYYLDNVQVHEGTPPPPPTFTRPYKPVTGFNALATSKGTGGQVFNREQVVTAADTGYTFVGQANPSYSFTIKSFPDTTTPIPGTSLVNTNNGWQAHFFIVNGAPGQFDQAADYNLADVLWFTVGPANPTNDAAGASFNFRLKTNQPGGNGMIFNTVSPTDTVNNPNGWPVEPIAALTDPNGAAGTWNISISGNTSITVTSPSGLSTNFSITPDQAALFADPVTLILGGQPNNASGEGQAVIYSSFSASGVASPISDNFLADSSFNTNIWKTTVANDTNGVILVPSNALYLVSWSLPDGGFAFRTKSQLETAGGWTQPAPLIIRNGNVAVGTNFGADQALVLSSTVVDTSKAYFQLIQFHASTLQVLFAGQTNDPSNVLGYDGTPTPISGAEDLGASAIVTVNAVDSTFHIDTSVIDIILLSSNADPAATEPNATAMVNGVLANQTVLFTAANVSPGWTVTATDQTNPNPPNATGLTAGTSVPISVSP